jgi:hypothetical protein
MEKTVVKRAADVVTAVTYMIDRQA